MTAPRVDPAALIREVEPAAPRRWAAWVLDAGIDGRTPTGDVDRAVYGNWLYLIAFVANAAMAVRNLVRGFEVHLLLNLTLALAFGCSFALSARGRGNAARVWFLAVVLVAFIVMPLVQGPGLRVEHFLLPTTVLAVGMFGRSERRYGIAFALVMASAYLVLVARTGPAFDLDPDRLRYTAFDRIANDVCCVAVLVAALLAIGAAHARAIQLTEQQRTKLFQDARLSTLGTTASAIANEITAPVLAMELLLGQLEERLAGAPALAEAADQARTLIALARRIGATARGVRQVAGAAAADARVAVPLGELVDAVSALAATRARPLGIELAFELADRDARVLARTGATAGILLDLLDNAIHAMTARPVGARWIRLSARVAGTRAVLAVTDAGRIDAPETRRRLFEPFYTTKPLGQGTGVGLCVSRRLAAQDGGRLWFDAEADHTRFVLELPLAAAGAAP